MGSKLDNDIIKFALRKKHSLIQKDTHTSILIVALFAIDKIWKQPKCPLTNEWIKNK